MYRLLAMLCVMFAPVMADWNAEFDQQTQEVLQAIPHLKTDRYLSLYNKFVSVRNLMLYNDEMRKNIVCAPPSEKATFFSPIDQMIVKKRRHDHIHELFAWEMACCMGIDAYMIPSFPIEMMGKKVIVQTKEKFTYGRGKIELPSSCMIDTVSVLTYWKAHLCAYLLGLADLVGRNIGIDLEGNIRFFDAEVCFSYHNTPIRTERGFTAGFIAESFEWPQYRVPLRKEEAEELEKFINALGAIEDVIQAYEKIRGVTIFCSELQYRLDRLRTFSWEEGKSFRDFFGFLYPKMSPGLDQLSNIVSNILDSKVDHGGALIFVIRRIHKHDLSASQKKAMKRWMDEYIGF